MDDSNAPLTPSPSAARPSILRRSAPYTDPRFSTVDGRGKRPGLLRFVVGIVAVGVLAIGGYTLVNRYAPPTESKPQVAAEDGRVDKFLQEGNKRSTYLPSVWESIAEPQRFVSELRIKAGLPADGWSDDMQVWVYTTEEFS